MSSDWRLMARHTAPGGAGDGDDPEADHVMLGEGS
jgi:hypothetical protein